MEIIELKNPLALASEAAFHRSQLVFAEDGEGLPILTDEVIGQALGYADPVAACECLYRRNVFELGGHSAEGVPSEPALGGRARVRVFYLQGALALCRLARTPASASVFGFLKAVEARTAAEDFKEELRAEAAGAEIGRASCRERV